MKTPLCYCTVSVWIQRQRTIMKFSALLILLVLADATLGELQKRVAGGVDCDNNEGRHHVVLTVKKDGKPDRHNYHCGGSLISDQWVLTAAHCDNKSLVALLNRHPDDRKELVGEISEKHKYSTPGKANEPHDILLLKLTKPFSHLTKIPLPPVICISPPASISVRFYGWVTISKTAPGVTKGKSFGTNTLLCGNLKVTDCGDLSVNKHELDPYVRSWSYGHMLCAKDPKKKVDSCSGDSGGSMIHNGVLFGIVSGGSSHMCALAVHFVDVCRYRAWIQRITKL